MKPIVSLITDAEWVEGVTIDRWLEANAPEAYREAVENKVWVLTIPSSPDEDWKGRRYWPAVAQCRKVLVEALEHKEINLRTLDPPDSSLAQWKSFPDHTQHAIAANWTVGARSGEEYLEHLRSYVFVRVFRADGVIDDRMADAKPAEEKKRRRPSRKKEIEEAFRRLDAREQIDRGKPLTAAIERVQDEIMEKAGNRNRKGIGPGAIRKYIVDEFKAEKASGSSPHNL